MDAIVTLTVVVALVILGACVVAALQLVKTLRTLADGLRTTRERLVPIADELQSELAVTSLEVDALRASAEQVAQERTARGRLTARRKRARRKARGRGR